MAAPQREGKPESPPEILPRPFGKYTLLRRLASGGMAELYLALQRSVAGFEKLIVIKRILPAMNSNKAFIEMLLHEARLAATFSHTNVVQTFDVGQEEGTYFIAMEHIPGEDIQAIVRAMKKKELSEFPVEHTLGIVIGMCAGLAYAHEKRDLEGKPLSIVHRDISPRNIVVSYAGDVKIVDFGIAKSDVGPVEDETAGHLKGKAPYMSPEQASGQPVDWRSDIFATGVMLFELTTGKRLFKGSSEFETLKLIVDKEYPRPSELRPTYPPGLERIVMRALAKDREARYQSARELQADLEAFVRDERIPVSNVALAAWMRFLFDDKLEQQKKWEKEALQDVKQLAGTTGAPPPASSTIPPPPNVLYEGPSSTTTSGATSPATPPTKRGSGAAMGLVAAAIALIAGGIFYARRDTPAPAAAEPAPAAQTAAPPAEAPAPIVTGALDVTTKPAGCAIWINGDLRPEVTPAHVDKLPLGKEIRLKLTKDGFETYRSDITLTDADPSRSMSVDMKAGSVTVLLKIQPQPAVWLDGKPWKGDRAKLDGLSSGDEHKIVVSANGFQPKTYVITAGPGETRTISDALVKGDSP